MNQKELVDNVIRNRRAIFPPMFTGEKIDDDIVKALMENANWAPTHRKTEPWRFVIFKGDALNELSEFCANAYKAYVSEESFSEKKFEKTKKKILASSHVIAICMQRSLNVSIPEWEELAAVSMAVQNIWLSCAAYGVGGYWSSPGYIENANEFLKLSEGQRCLGFFYLGVPNADIELKGDRSPIADKVIWR